MRECALVVLSGKPIGFAFVEANAARGTTDLLTRVLFLNPTRFAPDGDEAPPCDCPSEELELATVRPQRGGIWPVGVKVCLTHGLLRPA